MARAVRGRWAMRYDLVVVGNDEAALEISCAASAAGQRTLAVLPEQRHSEWMMGQSLTRLNSELLSDRSLERRRELRRSGSPKLLQRLIARSLVTDTREHMQLLDRLGADFVSGECRVHSSGQLSISSSSELRRLRVRYSNLVIGTGTRRAAVHRPLGLLPFLQSESLLSGSRMPQELIVLGGDTLGAGLATLFSLFGTPTRLLVHNHESCAAMELAHAAGVRIGTRPIEIGLNSEATGFSPQQPIVDCRRVVGFTDHLGLPALGIEPDEHGRLWCAANLETWSEGVFGIGDVVGFSTTVRQSATSQAERILNRIQHRIRRPHFLRQPDSSRNHRQGLQRIG